MLSIVLFGSPQLCLDQCTLSLLRRKNRALVYYLAAHPVPVRRERLLPLLWPEQDRAAAQHSLRTMLHGLRQTLGPALVVTDDTLALEPETDVDVRRFVAELTRLPNEPHRLETTLTLYRGDFLADFSLPDSPAFDDWIVAERERYLQMAVRALTTLAQQHAARAAWPAALTAIARAIELDPLREDVQCIAMQLQYLSGDRTGAIRRYEQLRKLLDEELGLPPTAETQTVYDAIITERLPPGVVGLEQAEPQQSRPAPPPHVSPPASAPQLEAGAHELPILATKLYLPRPQTELVSRPRLLARLAGGLTRPLTLISAPAGFGKTTVLADWLSHEEQRSQHVAWLGLDTNDSDPTHFLRYLIAALQTVAPMIGARVLNLLRSAQAPSLEMLMPLLLNDLVSLPPDSILVLDDYHVIDTPAVHQALAFLLDHLPPQLHMVIATRVDPPLPLARLRARRQLTELRAHDLRFTPEEAGQYLREVMAIPLSQEEVAALEARTEGWIAGLQLAALSIQDRPHEQMAHFIEAFTGNHRFVVDYLVDEVLVRQRARVQAFLLHTSILDRLSGALCDAVMHDDSPTVASELNKEAQRSSQSVLEDLERGNLFIVPLDDTRRWYRYHHLFAQVLRERLASGTSQDTVARLHRRASAWFEGQGLLIEAVQHALAAHDWERAAALIEAHGPLLMLRGQVHTVLTWLHMLPDTQLHERPYLYLIQALGLLFTNQLEDVDVRVQQAEQRVVADAADDYSRAILGSAALFRADIAQYRGDRASSLTWVHRALELLPATEVLGRSVCRVLSACAFQLSGDVSEINESLLRTAATAHVPSDLMTRFYAIVSLAELRRRQGRLRLAAATYREAIELAPAASGLQALINNGAAFYFGLGELRREQNDLDAAHDLLREGREMVLAGLLAEAEPITVGYTALSQLHLIRGDSSRALATLAELHEVARQRSFAPHLLARAESARAHLALLQEDLQTAVHWADTGTLRPDDDLSYPREVEYLTLARVRVAQGRTNPSTPNLLQTLNLLDRLLASAEAGARTDSVIKILILRALAFQVLGDPAAALATLEHALLLAAPEGYVRSFVDEGPPMAALLAEGLGQPAWGRGDGKQRHDVRTYANKLADVLRAEGVDLRADVYGPGASVQSVIAGVEPLTERELEVLRLLAAGRSNQGIAAELIVAVGTVKRHVSNIMDKLQAESRLEAVARARALGLL